MASPTNISTPPTRRSLTDVPENQDPSKYQQQYPSQYPNQDQDQDQNQDQNYQGTDLDHEQENHQAQNDETDTNDPKEEHEQVNRKLLGRKRLLASVMAEFLGSVFFVFVSTISVYGVTWVHGGGVLSAGLASGATYTLLVAVAGSISGGHFNPVVTSSVTMAGALRPLAACLYILAQLGGALVGSAVSLGVLGHDRFEEIVGGVHNMSMGVTQGGSAGGVTVGGGVLAEAMFTANLVLAVLLTGVNDVTKTTALMPAAVGFSVLVGVLSGAHSQGASMNPARALGPAVMMVVTVAGRTGRDVWVNHWVFWAGPMLGSLLAVHVYWWFDWMLMVVEPETPDDNNNYRLETTSPEVRDQDQVPQDDNSQDQNDQYADLDQEREKSQQSQNDEPSNDLKDQRPGRSITIIKLDRIPHDDMGIAKPVFAEMLGTAFFVFVGSMAVYGVEVSFDEGGWLVLLALSSGFAYSLLVSSTCRISGGHLNPAVTLGLLLAGAIHPVLAALYVCAQIAGATLGSLAVYGVLGDELFKMISGGGAQLSAGVSYGEGFLAEVMLTAILVTLVLFTVVDEDNRTSLAPLWAGLAVAVGVLTGVHSIGVSSMNPAHALGPTLVFACSVYGGETPAKDAEEASIWRNQELFCIGPLVGALLAVCVYRLFEWSSHTVPAPQSPEPCWQEEGEPAAREEDAAAVDDVEEEEEDTVVTIIESQVSDDVSVDYTSTV